MREFAESSGSGSNSTQNNPRTTRLRRKGRGGGRRTRAVKQTRKNTGEKRKIPAFEKKAEKREKHEI